MSRPAMRGGAGDPLELFGRLAEDAPGLGGDDEVAGMRRAVAALRRGRRVLGAAEGGEETAGTGAATPGRSLAAWRRAAALAVLVLGLLALATGGYREANPPAAAASATTPVTAPAPAAAPTAGEMARLPVFEGLDRPGTASVYQLTGEDLDLVMVVDETLDV